MIGNRKIYLRRQLAIILFVYAAALKATNIPIAIFSPDFSALYSSNWHLTGKSTIVNNRLQLTDDVINQSGTTFWTGTVCNSNVFKFSAFFSFTITHSGSSASYADGLAFIIQQYANNWGSSGGGLGYDGLPGKSIAIEYDTYKNNAYNDPSSNHIAIDFEGSVTHPSSEYYVDLSNLTSGGVTLTSGNTFYSWIDYDGTKLTVRINTTNTRPADPVFSFIFDLASYFDGENVFYGFSGATGLGTEKNIINSVYINNDYTPIDLSTNTYTQKAPSVSNTTDTICLGDNYSFNGNIYTTAGNFESHLTNSVGCDSTATLQLTVLKPSSSLTTDTICLGEIYSFNGKTYTTAGNFESHLTNSVGCDSTATLQLTVLKPSSSLTTDTICRGEGYSFNGMIYTTAGHYIAHLVNIVGCDSAAVLELKVTEPTSSITRVSICQGKSYLFNGQLYTSEGSYAVHLTNIAGCDSTATLQLTLCYSKITHVADTIYQNQNYSANGFSIPIQKKYGSHTFYQNLKTTQGCDSTVVLNLNVSPDFEVTIHPASAICADNKYFKLTYEITRGDIETDSITFGSDALKEGFKPLSMRNASGSINVPLPSKVVPNTYVVGVVFRNGYVQKEIPILIEIKYASSVILQKWNDVLALLNSNYNGGYDLLSYQWYKNNQILTGETQSYLYVKNGTLDTTAEYKVRVTRASDSVSIFTCPVIPVIKPEVIVFPTEFPTATNVTIRTPDPGNAILRKASGERINQMKLQRGDNSMLVSAPAGVYVLIITNEQGGTKQHMLIVK